ncbi:hypothetical protein BJV74DRAFT_58047 [Russula compacta]|nr:hypothetical protein BJV74DRAFT_58047 [Russula compacta]
MSSFVQLPPRNTTQSISEFISPGIVSLFIQGLETGLVISQFSQWLYLGHAEGSAITILVLFVTTVGFVETAVCFLSTWRIYVLNFGQAIIPGWTESVHVMLSTLVAAPIQAYFIYRCYHIVKKKVYLIAPLVVILISTIATAVWVTAWIFRMENPHSAQPTGNRIESLFVICLTLPAALDTAITSILLYSLTVLLRDIHAEHLRRRVSRYMVVIWQAAIPPSLCAIALLIKYVTFTIVYPEKFTMWYAAIQAMLGKLYVLSLFFTLNNRMDLSDEPPVTYVTTINGSLDGMGLPSQQYVYSVHYPGREQQC